MSGPERERSSGQAPWAERALERLYAVLLYLHPAAHRRRFGREMTEAFRDSCRHVREQHGRGRQLAHGLRSLLELVVEGARARTARPSRTTCLSRAAPLSRTTRLERTGRLSQAARLSRTASPPVQQSPSLAARAGILTDNLRDDLKYAARNLRRHPGFTATAVITLALGIGANTAVFSVVNGVILRPLPYPHPDELVKIYVARPERGWTRGSMSQPDLRSVQDEASSIAAAAGIYESDLTLTGMGAAEAVPGARVTDGVLGVFGLAPYLGRDIRREETVPGGPRVAVIGYGFWQERFAGDPDVLGTTLYISTEPHEIVGVAPPGFDYPEGAHLWIPLHVNTAGCGRDCHFLEVTARLAAGTTVEAASDEVLELSRSLEERYPVLSYGKRFNLITLEEDTVGDVRTALYVLLGAVGLVLLIAGANVANLFLARASSRSTELAMRAALGAGRGHIITQLLVEALLLGALAGVVGLALASGTMNVLLEMAPSTIPRLDQITLDLTVLLYTLAATVLITGLFGLLPSVWLARAPASNVLSQAGRTGSGGPKRQAARSTLLVVEVALSLMLLLGAGLLLRSFYELKAVPLGFDRNDVFTFGVSLPSDPYDYEPDRTTRFFEALEERIGTLPGVESVASIYGSPMAGAGVTTSIHWLDRPAPPEGQEDDINVRVVTPAYFEALRIPLLSGRTIEATDREGGQRVALVSRSLAEHYYPGRDPAGNEIRIDMNLGYGAEAPWTIVGVVGDVRAHRLKDEPGPEIYVPHAQMGSREMTVVARLEPGAEPSIAAVKGEVEALDPDVPLRDVEMLAETVDRQMGPARFYMTLLAVFAGVAVTLAAVGLYGVIAYLVSGRTREIGIRMALGARGGDVVRMVVVQGIRPAIAGVVLGVLGAYLGARGLRTLLYGVTPSDPLAVLGAIALLLGVAILAILLPARRASRVAPVEALRSE